MGFLDSLNDDQVALLGCAVALLLCGSAMVITFSLRRWGTGETRGSRGIQRREVFAQAEARTNAKLQPDDRKAA